MKKAFPGYQSRTPSKLWASCIFAFDANALLDLYRMTGESRAQLLSILDRLKDRVWLPHQAALEYLENRFEVIRVGIELRARISKWTHDATERFRKEFDRYRQYQWVDVERWVKILSRTCEEIDQQLDKEKWELEGFENFDPIEKRLSEIFADERLGKPYSDTLEVFSRAEQRIKLSIPPGFKDAAQKKDYHRYGDVVLWFQLLEFAKSSQKAIVFVTGDSKEDWWQRQNGKTVGPRPELIQEMHVVAGVAFHMYTPATFIEHAGKYLELQREATKIKAAAKELRDIEIRNIPSIDMLPVLKGLYPEDALAGYLARDIQNPWAALESSDVFKNFMKGQDSLAKILYPSSVIASAFNEAFISPFQNFKGSLEHIVNTTNMGVMATAAQFAQAMQNVTSPLGVSRGPSSSEAKPENVAESTVPTDETHTNSATVVSPETEKPQQESPDSAPNEQPVKSSRPRGAEGKNIDK
jgi:PIN domain-containing protein